MKKIKSALWWRYCQIFLVGTVFAGDTAGGGGADFFFGRMADAVYSLFRSADVTAAGLSNLPTGTKDEKR